MRLRLIEDWAEIRKRADEWNSLLDGSAPEHKFLTFEWCDALRRAHAPQGAAPVLVAEEAGRLAAVWPLVLVRHRLGGVVPCRLLADPSHWFSPHHGIACAGNCAETLLECLKFLHEHLPHWDVLEVSRLVENGEAHRAIETACRQLGLPFEGRPGSASPYLPLDGTWEGYLAACSSKFRSDLKRCEKSVSQLGQVEYHFHSDPAELARTYEHIIEIERQSWKHASGSAISARPWEDAFYRELVERAGPRGWLEATLLTVDDQPIAHDLGLIYRGRYACLKTSFVERVRSANVGKTLRRRIIESHYARGIREHDLLGEAEPWKMQWTRALRPHVSLTIYRRKWLAALVAGLRKVRSVVRPKAPAETTARAPS